MTAKKITVIVTFLLIALFPSLGLTENEIDSSLQRTASLDWPTSPLTGINFQEIERAGEVPQIHHLIEYLYGWGVGIGGFLVFVVLVFAGVQYMTAAGNPEKTKEAMERISSAIMGLILLLSSFLILEAINPGMTQIRDVREEVEQMEMRMEGYDPRDLEEPACEFIKIYEEGNFEGESVRLERGTHTISDIERGAGLSSFHSLKMFRKLDEEEADRYLENGEIKEDVSHDERDIIIEDDIPYIETHSSCRATVYRETRSTLFGITIRSTPCGRQVGIINNRIKSYSELNDVLFPEKGTVPSIDCMVIETVGEGEPADFYADLMPDVEIPPGKWKCAKEDPCETDGILFSQNPSKAKDVCDPEELKDPDNPEDHCKEEEELWCCPPVMPDVPHYAQGDPRWGYKIYGRDCDPQRNMSYAGCGPTSAAMMLSYYGIPIDPWDAAQFALQRGHRVCGSGTYQSLFSDIADHYGLKYIYLGQNTSEVRKYLENGYPVGARVYAPPLRADGRTGGHYIVFTGIDEKYLYINDSVFNHPVRVPQESLETLPYQHPDDRGSNRAFVILPGE